MNESLGLGECKALEHFCWKDVKDNLSFKAMDANGNCVGVFLSALGVNSNVSPDNNDQHEADDMIYRRHEKFYRIIKLATELDRRVDLANRYPLLCEFVEGKVLSVDSKYRGMGIAGLLVQRTFEEMVIRGLPLMSIQCSSYYSAQVMLKLGFDRVAAIPYKDFVIDGRPAIAPKAPHLEISAFTKWVAGQEQEQLQTREGKSQVH